MTQTLNEKLNLYLWNNVSTTDPTKTKPPNQSCKFTTINPTYMVMKATEQWGMIGLNWGYDILDDRIDSGAPVYNASGEILGNVLTHTIKLCVWVKDGDNFARVEHFGHTPYVYYSRNNGYWITDQEAPKKSLTDALKKCLSMFGFCADIYLGMFDDINYVEEVKAQAAIDNADDKAAEVIKQRQQYDDLLIKNLKLIKTATSLHELEAIYKSISRKAKRQNDNSGLRKINTATEKRKTELSTGGEKKPEKAKKSPSKTTENK